MAKKLKKKPRPGSAHKIVKRTATKDGTENSNTSIATDGNEKEKTVSTTLPAFPCKHLEKGINLEKLRSLVTKPVVLECLACLKVKDGKKEKKGKGNKKNNSNKKADTRIDISSFYICLACGHVACGRNDGDGHSWQHWLYCRHPYALVCNPNQIKNIENLACWCFPCHTLLNIESAKERKNSEESNDSASSKQDDDDNKQVQQESLYMQAISFVKQRILHASDEETTSAMSELKSSKMKVFQQERVSLRNSYIVKGLSNLGNTCFFNSVVQNLLALGALRSYFTRPVESPEGPITSALRNLFVETSTDYKFADEDRKGWKGGSVIIPRGLFGSICAKASQFRGYGQHDSHELLRCLISNLSFELSANQTSASQTEVDDDNSEESSSKKKSNENGESGTLVDEVFQGQLCSTIACTKCGYSKPLYEPFNDLSLPLPTKKSASRKKPSSPPWSFAQNKTKGRQRWKGNDICKVWEKNTYNSAMVEPVIKDDALTIEAVESSVVYGPATKEETLSNQVVSISALEDVNSLQNEDLPASQDACWLDYLDSDAEVIDSLDQKCLYSSGNEASTTFAIDSDAGAADSLDQKWLDSLQIEASTTSADAWWLDYLDSDASVSDSFNQKCHDGKNIGDLCKESLVSEWTITVPDSSEVEEPPLPVLDNSQVLLLPYYQEDDIGMEEESKSSQIFPAVKQVSADDVVSGFKTDDISTAEDIGEFEGLGNLFEGEEESLLEKKVSKENVSETCFFEENVSERIWEDDDCDCVIPMSVHGCLVSFTKPELLSGENAWKCEKCASKVKNKSDDKENGKVNLLNSSNKAIVSLVNNVLDAQVSMMPKACNGERPSVINGSSIGEECGLAGPSTIASDLEHDRFWNEEVQNINEDKTCCEVNIIEKPNMTSSGLNSGENCKYAKENCNKKRRGKKKTNVDVKDSEAQSNTLEDDYKSTKRYHITKTPLVLTIHLKRFSQDMRGRISKLSGHVSFQEDLDISPFLHPRFKGKDDCFYRLVGVVEHSGSMISGHYVAYVRCRQDDFSADSSENVHTKSSWHYISDNVVRNVSLSEVLRSEAYLLFYEKCQK